MWLDLKDMIEVPGTVKTFTVALDPEHLTTAAIRGFTGSPVGSGTVTNTAGLLELTGTVSAEMQCVCDRCGREFTRRKRLEVRVPLAAEPEDDGDAFPLDRDGVEADQVLETCFILDAESRCLCKSDCLGLCPNCGKDLNDGPCNCTKPRDPRFAVLEQLLDKDSL